MSRGRVHEVSSPLSLFPFIGILLCTMGALLVILVVVSRSAKTTAQRTVQSRQSEDIKAAKEGAQKKLEATKAVIGKLGEVRGQAQTRLRDQQARLSHVEDHIRRLRERIEALQSADIELQKLEQEHSDDHQQAEREINRLYRLIADSQKSVTSLQEASSGAKRSYAVVPYEGPNGTYRRPIYIECLRNELIIQPEGIHIKANDLQPPVTPGNPLATVLRATRDHLLRLNPQAIRNRDTEPYALLLVRPEGFLAYYAAREAVEAGDFDLGFELIEKDWKIKYPEPDAQLAGLQAQALDQARARQELLAAAAPRAYAGGARAASGGFDDDDARYSSGGGRPGGGGMGGGGSGGSGVAGVGTGRGGATRDYIVHNQRQDADDSFGGDAGDGGGDDGSAAGSGEGGSPGGGSSGGGTGSRGAAGSTAVGSKLDSGSLASGDGGSGGAEGGLAPAGATSGGGGAGGGSSSGGNTAPSGAPVDKSLVPDGYQTQDGGASMVAGSGAPPDTKPSTPEEERRREKERVMGTENRGKDWALKQKPPKSVPVRRTIRVTVNKNQIAIAPDSGPGTAGKVIPMPGDTVESVDEFVKQVRAQIDGWGIAGTNLYWRPVVVLSVGPDGQQRASDLARLLKNSGLEIKADETAKNVPIGGAHETR